MIESFDNNIRIVFHPSSFDMFHYPDIIIVRLLLSLSVDSLYEVEQISIDQQMTYQSKTNWIE